MYLSSLQLASQNSALARFAQTPTASNIRLFEARANSGGGLAVQPRFSADGKGTKKIQPGPNRYIGLLTGAALMTLGMVGWQASTHSPNYQASTTQVTEQTGNTTAPADRFTTTKPQVSQAGVVAPELNFTPVKADLALSLDLTPYQTILQENPDVTKTIPVEQLDSNTTYVGLFDADFLSFVQQQLEQLASDSSGGGPLGPITPSKPSVKSLESFKNMADAYEIKVKNATGKTIHVSVQDGDFKYLKYKDDYFEMFVKNNIIIDQKAMDNAFLFTPTGNISMLHPAFLKFARDNYSHPSVEKNAKEGYMTSNGLRTLVTMFNGEHKVNNAQVIFNQIDMDTLGNTYGEYNGFISYRDLQERLLTECARMPL